MNIAERIQLHRLGYTKEEINELAKADYDPKGLTDPPADPEQPEPERPEPDQTDPAAEQPAPQNDERLLAAIDKLTAAIQARNIQTDGNKPERDLMARVDDVLNQLTK